LIIDPSTWLPEKTLLHSLTLNNVSKTYKEWNSISEYAKGTNGKLGSKPAKDYLNQK